jgi:hypothetical protein
LSPIRKLLVDEHQDACGLLRSAISNGKRASGLQLLSSMPSRLVT